MDLPIIAFATSDEWAAWLDANHASAEGLRIKFAKKGSGIPSVTWAEAVKVALCYGWIDSQANRVDDQFWTIKFTPRRPRSKWSQVNCAHAEELIASGKMREAGLREVERAKADGRWEAAYAPSSTITVPDDLQQALDANDTARAAFESLNSQNRYAILHRLHDAKRPETRVRRIEKFIDMLSRNEKIHP
jgi:uncharacterized protein YdeI (YjbR/CyaY-like superfamily)